MHKFILFILFVSSSLAFGQTSKEIKSESAIKLISGTWVFKDGKSRVTGLQRSH